MEPQSQVAPQQSPVAPQQSPFQQSLVAPQQLLVAPQQSLVAPQQSPVQQSLDSLVAPQQSLVAPQQSLVAPQQFLLWSLSSSSGEPQSLFASQQSRVAPQQFLPSSSSSSSSSGPRLAELLAKFETMVEIDRMNPHNPMIETVTERRNRLFGKPIVVSPTKLEEVKLRLASCPGEYDSEIIKGPLRSKEEIEKAYKRQTESYVAIALDHYNATTKGRQYKLVETIGSNAFTMCGFWTHVCFLAKPVSAAIAPTSQFFAEIAEPVARDRTVFCCIVKPHSDDSMDGCGDCPPGVGMYHPKAGFEAGNYPGRSYIADESEERRLLESICKGYVISRKV